MRALLDDEARQRDEEEDESDRRVPSDDSDDAESDDGGEHDDEEAASPPSSPEPDFILAEVVNSSSLRKGPALSEPAISLPLIHRVMQSHFTGPEKTSISSDARALVGKYVEIFVKEGIRRCVDEKKEREANGGATAAGVDNGWLELEDLERVATQLCMDF
jgi:hypothetical protein